MTNTLMTALEQASHLTAGVSGDELIRRRQASLCVACGVTKVFAPSASGEQPWLCAQCLKQVPRKAPFDQKQHREDGIRNLQRLEAGDGLD